MCAYRINTGLSWTDKIISDESKNISINKKIVDKLKEVNEYTNKKYNDSINKKIIELEFNIFYLENNFEMMKKEIIDVIKKYIEIDEESLEVELTRGVEVGLEGPALYANIPIKNVKPVAPKSKEEEEQEEKEAVKMTEQEAEEVAEKILNHAEELLNKAKNEDETTKEADLLKENEEEKNEEKIEEIEEVKQPKKEESKTKTKSTAKKTVKKTSTKPKKETKKSENH